MKLDFIQRRETGSESGEDPYGSALPLEVYDTVVRSLHGDTRTLFWGKIATCSAAFVSWYRSDQSVLLFAGIVIGLIAIIRVMAIAWFNMKARKTLSHKELKAAEFRYRVLSGLYVTSLGVLCFLAMAVTSDSMTHLIVISATLANVAGISGRNFASRKVIDAQALGVTIPLTLGLVLFGGPYHIFLAALLLPFLLAIQSIAGRLRSMLFAATFQAMENKTMADRFAVALENASHGMAMIDSDGVFLVVNERFAQLFGLPEDFELVGASLTEITVSNLLQGNSSRVGISVNDSISERLRICLKEERQRQFTQTRQDGATIEISFNPMKEGAGVIVLEDVSARVRSESEIRQLANYDPLTHLPNRRFFTSQVKEKVASGLCDSYSLFFADLDNFKTINDSLGHSVGDKLLCAVSLRMQSCLPEDGMICRFGGDEFVIILPNVEASLECERFAKRLIAEVSKPVLIDGHLIIVGSSVGIAQRPGNSDDFDQLLKMADVALYEAKARGRGTLNFYSDELGAKIRMRRKLEVDLRRAVQRGELSVHYQPLIDLNTNKVSCCEALVRWNHPEHGPISPGEFIPMAEEIGIISRIGKFVLEAATRECMKWPSDVRVAVNVSSLQFQQSDVCSVIEEALLSSGLPANRLEIEVTESAVLDDMRDTSMILRTLAQSGVRISLDDFGTGFSSLSYLHQLPLDKVKIDRSFVESIRDDKRSLILLSGVSRMAAELGLLVIVEGVEESEQLDILKREVHFDQVQGYLFGKAMPPSEISAFIRNFNEGADTPVLAENQSA